MSSNTSTEISDLVINNNTNNNNNPLDNDNLSNIDTTKINDTKNNDNMKINDTKNNNNMKINDTTKNNDKPNTTTTYHNDHIANEIKVKEQERESSSKISNISEDSDSSINLNNNSSKNKKPLTQQLDSPRSVSSCSVSFHKDSQQPTVQQPTAQQQTTQHPDVEIKFRKIEILKKLLDLKEKGFKLTKTYDYTSQLEEMEYEYEVLKRYADKRNGLKIARNLLINSVSILEFMNNSYNPIDFQLEGWAEHTQVEIDNYDDVLDELWEKYKITGKKFSPEIRLIFMLTASSAAYHFTKSHTKKTPDRSFMNPSMVAKLFNNKPQQSKYVTPQELNIQQQQEIAKTINNEKQKNNYINNYQSVESTNIDIVAPSDVDSILKNTEPSNNVKDVLNRIHSDNNGSKITTETNISDKPKRGRGRPKKDQSI